jgi:hypothetical protein
MSAGCGGRGLLTPTTGARRFFLILCLLSPSVAQAQDEPRQEPKIDTEHIFGFTEGADIGEKGELELENTTVGRLGRPGTFAVFDNETALRYGLAERFRASVGALVDYYDIQNVLGLMDRERMTFSGLSSQFRWKAIEGNDNGLTFSFAPQWRRVDDTAGQDVESYAFPLGLLADTALVPNQTFTAFNLFYSPTLTRMNTLSQQEQPLELSQAIATAITEGIFVGAEIRHITRNQDGFFTGHALFVGPSLFVKVSDNVSFKVAWSAQIPDETRKRLDLVNFERYQVIAVLVKGF